MSEAFNEEVAAFRKACNDLRLKMPKPEKRHALRVLSDKRIRKQPSETRFYLHCWTLTPEETQVLQEMLEKKGNELMDEEFFTEEAIKRLTEPEGAAPRNSEYYESLVVDIETYTEHALKLQMAIIEAETQLESTRQKHREVESHLNDLAKQRREAATAVKSARAKLQEHLDLVRKTHVTLRGGRHE